MPRSFYVLLVFVPISILGGRFGLPGWLQFFTSVAAVVPLAGLIGEATDQAALTYGPKIGGILNATFGNVPDLLVGYYGVQAGLLGFVRATLVGGIISNTGLIIGLSFFAAGVRHGMPRFDAREAGHHAVLMILAIGGMLLPSIAFATVQPPPHLLGLSIGVSIILLLAYLAYVAFSIFGLVGGKRPSSDAGPEAAVIHEAAGLVERRERRWPLPLTLAVLLVATAFLGPVTDALVAAVTPTVATLGWTENFVGVVFVANAGNAAEMYTAILMALAGRLNLSLDVASGSSIQIATFVTPAIVLLSLGLHPMDLVFTALELAILGLVVAIFAYVVYDGETNWLEGVQLLAIYAIAAAVFFVLPGS